MTIKNICLAVYRIHLNSKKNIHIIIFFFAIVLSVIFIYKKINIDENEKTSILTGLSLLSSVYLLAVEHIDLKKINELFNNHVKISKNKSNKESVVIRDTVLALSFNTFSLIGISFIFKLFNIEYIYLLIWIICYLFFGIIYNIILWNYTLSKQ